MKKVLLRNRFTLLTTVLLVYVLAIVGEGLITGRKPDLLRLDNSLFELNVKELNEFSEGFK